MRPEEQRRLDEATRKAHEVPLSEHVVFKWLDDVDWLSCVKCGLVQPRTGYSKPCRGWSKVTLR